jgi:hypothetical protein
VVVVTRRPLTLDEAQRGVQPEPNTREQWHALHMASAQETRDKHFRLIEEYNEREWRGVR